jgi:hypothetical protein
MIFMAHLLIYGSPKARPENAPVWMFLREPSKEILAQYRSPQGLKMHTK